MAISTGEDRDDVMSEINITPLVDVMLVLLIVFIVTAPLLTNVVKVSLPRTQQTQPLKPQKSVTVTVDAHGVIYIGKTQVDIDVLQQQLQEQKQTSTQLNLNLQADQAVPYGDVAKVMAVIQRAGVDHLSVLTVNGQ